VRHRRSAEEVSNLIIRDPVHGDVEFNTEEKAVLDTSEVQRLRGIKQLGTSYLVYPGALHTRFDHSIGTMAVAKRIIGVLRAKGFEISPQDEMIIAVSALVHDVTHVPFGHTFEDERRILPGHEKGGRLQMLLSGGDLSDRLNELGIKAEVVSLLKAREPIEEHLGEPWRAQVVKDSISADLLDYLRRDSYFTGLQQDYDNRVFRYFTLANFGKGRKAREVLAVDLGKEGMVRQDARSEVLHLLRMRYFLTERVYYHHAKQSSGAMISKALEMAIGEGLEPTELVWMNDWTLLEAFKSRFAATRRLVEGVEDRRLLKRAFVLGAEIGASRRNELIAEYNRPGRARDELEGAIRDELGARGLEAEEDEVIVHCPDLGAMKEARVFARDEEGMVERLHRHRRPISRDLDHIENQYLAIWNFYVFSQPRLAAEVNRICGGILESERTGFAPKAYQ
jgi:HD superfamily phosphohydrolase